MRIPVIRGIIDRRILANYHIDPEVMARRLPPPFRPKLTNGFAIGGICLIRLKSLRPRFVPSSWGIRSENAAHRIAVEWDVDGRTQEGVYIPRRDTNSRFNTWAGGTLFPGLHHHARFTVKESSDHFSVALQSDDGDTRVLVSGIVTDHLPDSSVFPSVAAASKFFEMGSLGYSVTRTNGRFDGLELLCENWHVDPLEIDHVESSYFENELQFPRGSVGFDCALLMRGIRHEWHGRKDLCCAEVIEE
ncbi:MAG: DUF2071 domain-containing protein [Planctomycetota bacterium]|nr:DUF2071 domain-containing protein [Planctomycetota bacterium]MDA1213686.1 DUF2071 domain-containing protein [Planctomycetota bacterium]